MERAPPGGRPGSRAGPVRPRSPDLKRRPRARRRHHPILAVFGAVSKALCMIGRSLRGAPAPLPSHVRARRGAKNFPCENAPARSGAPRGGSSATGQARAALHPRRATLPPEERRGARRALIPLPLPTFSRANSAFTVSSSTAGAASAPSAGALAGASAGTSAALAAAASWDGSEPRKHGGKKDDLLALKQRALRKHPSRRLRRPGADAGSAGSDPLERAERAPPRGGSSGGCFLPTGMPHTTKEVGGNIPARGQRPAQESCPLSQVHAGRAHRGGVAGGLRGGGFVRHAAGRAQAPLLARFGAAAPPGPAGARRGGDAAGDAPGKAPKPLPLPGRAGGPGAAGRKGKRGGTKKRWV